MDRIRLAIVGSTKFSDWWGLPAAQGIIVWTLARYEGQLEAVISGGAEGIDQLAAREARAMGLQVVEHLPENPRWEPDGYKARNHLIAEDCTHLLAIRSKSSTSYGSGWTADQAERLGRTVQRIHL